MAKIIRAADLARQAASKVRVPPVPYVLGGRSDKGTDCINLVGWCVQELGGAKSDVPKGSNTAWRTVMQWTGDIKQAKQTGRLVPGALVYVKRAPTDKWPDGDYGHVGVYAGAQPGWPPGHVIAHASTVGGVTTCPMQDRWAYVAWLKCVDYSVRESEDQAAVSSVPYANRAAGTSIDQTAEQIVAPTAEQTVDQPLTAARKARVETTSGMLNVRKQPMVIADNRIAKLNKGDVVDVLEVRGEWSRIKVDATVGWAQSAFLRPFA